MKIIDMSEMATVSSNNIIRTHSVNGCNVCVMVGEKSIFMQHTISAEFEKITNFWESKAKELNTKELTLYVAVEEDEKIEQVEIPILFKKYLSTNLKLNIVYYLMNTKVFNENYIEVSKNQVKTDLKILN